MGVGFLKANLGCGLTFVQRQNEAIPGEWLSQSEFTKFEKENFTRLEPGYQIYQGGRIKKGSYGLEVL